MARKKVSKRVSRQVVEPGGPGSDPPKKPSTRERYGSFFEAWPKVAELRKYTTQQGRPRIALEGADLAKAEELLNEYKDG